MANPSQQTQDKPEYLRQRERNRADRAFTRINGRKLYLGTWNSEASHISYSRLLAEWACGAIVSIKPDEKITIIELCQHYHEWAKGYYEKGSGTLCSINGVLAVLNQLYGTLSADQFSPLKLEAVMQAFVKNGITRVGVNARAKQIKHMIKWATSKELVPAGVYQALQCVPGLKRGRTAAPETDPVKPARLDHIEAIKPYLLPVTRDALDLLLLTGARPSEMLKLRIKDIVANEEVWHSEIEQHKNANKGKKRYLYFGPKAQIIVKRRMAGKRLDDYLFSPKDAIRERSEKFDTHRRPDQKPNLKKTYRVVRGHYTADTFRRAINRACGLAEDERKQAIEKAKEQGDKLQKEALEKLGKIHFTPYMIRHTAATIIRAKYGLEQARAVLGHETPDMTLIYAERDEKAVRKVMKQIG